MKIVGIVGSLRQDSFNLALLRAAQDVAPAGVELAIHTLNDIPLFNEDLEAQGMPEGVQALRTAISQADALLFATPEYNGSIPGVLKNAIDWVSRPGPQREFPFTQKPVAITGATPGGFGTVRAQMMLRQLTAHLNMYVLNKPELLVSHAMQKFSAGVLTDEETRQQLAKLVQALVDWTQQLRKDS